MEPIGQESRLWQKISFYLKVNEADAASRIVQRNIEEKGRTAENLCYLGIIQYTQGEFSEAQKSWQSALELNPDLQDATYCLAIFYCDLGDYLGADKLISAQELKIANDLVTSLDKKIIAANYANNAEVFWGLNQNSDAVSEFQKALNYDQHDLELVLRGSKMLISLERYADALTLLSKGERIAPNHDEICYLIGIVHLRHKKLQLAQDYFSKSFSLNPKNSAARSLVSYLDSLGISEHKNL